MTNPKLDRRIFLVGLGASGVALAAPALASVGPLVEVLKDPSCGCCGAWIDIMQREGFEMAVQNASWETLSQFKATKGVPEEMTSCHTGLVEGYVIEGHVPPTDIRRLLAERPDAIGLTVPGMPFGSPGMGPESEREAYSVFLIRKDGTTEVFSHYRAA
ncbi:DUF411 domain-containing protein [Ruegeria arenilitoris]|uniref:DUF411 domain-containing protein n=1 Tax=Ruegeria arenilitoris TaxID=1173585 RepID=UPI001481656A|nr:DUF411 domain-containing protein [Ruegeria arenilitoris]